MTLKHKSSEIAQALYDRMANIRVANGYETDIGAKVFRGRRKIEDDSVPCGVLIEGNDSVKSRPGKVPMVELDQGYVLGGYVPCDPDHPNDAAHALIRDLKKAVFGDGGDLGKQAIKVSYTGRDIGPRPDGVAIVMAIIEINVNYIEDLTNP